MKLTEFYSLDVDGSTTRDHHAILERQRAQVFGEDGSGAADASAGEQSGEELDLAMAESIDLDELVSGLLPKRK